MTRPLTNTNGDDALTTLLRASVASGNIRGHLVAGDVATSQAVRLWRMRRAAGRFVSAEAARELVGNVGSVLALDPTEDVAALVVESVARLRRMSGQHRSPVLPEQLDVGDLARAVAKAWEAGR